MDKCFVTCSVDIILAQMEPPRICYLRAVNYEFRKESLKAAVVKLEPSGRKNRHVQQLNDSLSRDAARTSFHPQTANMNLQKLLVYLSTACYFCYMVGLNFMLKIMHFISPSFTKKLILRIGEKTTMTQNPKFKYEDWGLTFTSLNFIKTASKHMWLSLGQEAFEGGKAPDTPVVTMKGEKTSICNFLKGAL